MRVALVLHQESLCDTNQRRHSRARDQKLSCKVPNHGACSDDQRPVARDCKPSGTCGDMNPA